MRIQVHDFGGYPFPAELSRYLAAHGETVQHLYSPQYAANLGNLAVGEGDPDGLTFHGVVASRPADKYHPVRRLRFESAYADAWIAHLEANPVDVVVCANVPLVALSRFARWAKRRRQAWVLWHQDVVSAAMAGELARMLPGPAARLGAVVLDRIERRSALGAERVVAIGPGFLPVYRRWGLDRRTVSVEPNWAPLDEVVPHDRDGAWVRGVGLSGTRPRVVYSGTLGRKHRPELLLELGRRMRAAGSPVTTVVVSEGASADMLAAAAVVDPDLDLRVLPFQPFEQLPEVLGAGDCLVALLEPDASTYSVPSKVLSYLAAGRPVLGFMPADNPAAVDVAEAGGIVVSPDLAGVDAAVERLRVLLADTEAVADVGRRARALAEQRFDIGAIGSRFDRLLREAAGAARVVDQSV